MTLETPRLIIRRFKPSDLTDLHEILSDAETMRFCEPPYDLEKTDAFLRDFCIARQGALAAAEKTSGKVIGYILFKSFGGGEFEAGWFINRGFWRQGYAYEAMGGIFERAFSYGAVRIFAETIDPVKSVGLMKKLGMKLCEVQKGEAKDLDGNACDMYVYELWREDFINM